MKRALIRIVVSVGLTGLGCQGSVRNGSATTRFPDAIAEATSAGGDLDARLFSTKDNELLATLHVGASEANWQDHLGKVRTIRVDEQLESLRSPPAVPSNETHLSALPRTPADANRLVYDLYRSNSRVGANSADSPAAVPYDYPLGDPKCHNADPIDGMPVICCNWQNMNCCMVYTPCNCMQRYCCDTDDGQVCGGGGCPRCYYAQHGGKMQLVCDPVQSSSMEQSCGTEQSCGA
jgi:hypothetical protein